MMISKEKSLNFGILTAFIVFTTAFSAQAAEKYAATVEDGTAKVMAANTNVDDENEGEVITEEHVTRRVLRSPRRLTAKTTPVVSTPVVDAAPANPAPIATPAAVVVAPAPVATPAPTANPEIADLKKRVEVLEQAKGPSATEAQPAVKAVEPTPAVVKALPITAPAPVAKADSKFDVVPDNHINEFAQRLKYTNDILKRFGRAYDYRTTTLKEFKAALKDLESAQEKTKGVN